MAPCRFKRFRETCLCCRLCAGRGTCSIVNNQDADKQGQHFIAVAYCVPARPRNRWMDDLVAVEIDDALAASVIDLSVCK